MIQATRRCFSLSVVACFPLMLAWSVPSLASADADGLSAFTPGVRPAARVEILPLPYGVQLLTLFSGDTGTEVPLVSVLRDTLGSVDHEVHVLRYVWVHTFAAPSLRQRLAAAIPFMYSRFGNARTVSKRSPAPVMDLSRASNRLVKTVWEVALKGTLVDPKTSLLVSALRTYDKNRSAYLESQLARISTALEFDDAHTAAPAFSSSERRQLQRRLAERSRSLAGLLNEAQLERLYLKELTAMHQACAQNWDLLRQRAESEGLYFEPLLLPDGTATHGLLLVAREDVELKRGAPFDGRFLSISRPWGDKQLLSWPGPVEVRYFDSESRAALPAAPGAKRVELIPLALYGLNHPKIPGLLIDFRSPLNAKRRELSRQAAQELGTKLNTGVGLLNFLINAGHTAAGVVARRTGKDFLQPSRAVSYSQLKTVLSMNTGLSSVMRAEISLRAEYVATNPLENDSKIEAELAVNQYRALIDYAQRPGGLQARLDRDRRAELTASAHGGTSRLLLRAAGAMTLGLYTHREKRKPETESNLEAQRRLMSRRSFLQDVIKSGSHIEVQWDSRKVRNALRATAASDSISNEMLAETAFHIFTRARDDETRRLCLETLRQLDADSARQKLLRIAQDRAIDAKWRALSASYLGLSNDLQLAGNESPSAANND